MKRLWTRLVLAAAALLLLPGTLAASAPAAPSPVAVKGPAKVTLSAAPGVKGLVQLEARLTGADGKPLGEQTVSFRLGTSFFGDRSVLLGREVTDSAGVATFLYAPVQPGEAQFLARFAAPDGAVAEGNASYKVIAVTGAPVAHAEESALASLRRMTGLTAAALTLIVWTVLLFTLLRVHLGIARQTPRPQFLPVRSMDPSSTKGD